MERFKRQSDEKILLKAPSHYLRGEQTFKRIMFESAAMDCKAVLTTQRFVALQERRWNTLGPLFFFVALLIPKKMIFEIYLQDLAAVTEAEDDQHAFILRTVDNEEFKLRLNSLKDAFGGNTRNSWTQKIREAKGEVCASEQA